MTTLADRIIKKEKLRTPQCFHTLSCMYVCSTSLAHSDSDTDRTCSVRNTVSCYIFKGFLSIISYLQKIVLTKFIPPQLKYFSSNSCGFSKSVYITYVFDFNI